VIRLVNGIKPLFFIKFYIFILSLSVIVPETDIFDNYCSLAIDVADRRMQCFIYKLTIQADGKSVLIK